MELSEKDIQMIQDCRENGVGVKVKSELLAMYHAERETEFTVSTEYGDCRVMVYYPSEEAKLPVVFDVHGGGFVKGIREQDIVFCRNMCQNTGYIVMDIDYAKAPEVQFPGQIYQIYEVIRYVSMNAAELHVDPDRMALCGHSAGGGMSVAVNMIANERKEFSIKLEVLDYAGLDYHTPPQLKESGYMNDRIPPDKADFYDRMYLKEEDKLNPLASPLFAPDHMLENLPATLMIICEYDGFCSEDSKFASRLIDLGVQVTARRFRHSRHGFVVKRTEEFEDATALIFRTLQSEL